MRSITVSGLTAGYEHAPVLEDLDLTVASGATTAILGASGGGKTTLLRAIAGFLRPSAGRIELGEQVLSDERTFLAPHRRPVGYVRQDGALFPHLDVAANITFGLPRSQRRRTGTVHELLELVGLPPDLARRRPDQLSGGQQQRIALARALARQPDVVLLDEPFSSLDASLRTATRTATAAALAERGATTVLVTHDQTEALSFADQVAILRDGHLVQVGLPHEVYTAPADPDLARFLGDAVVLPAVARGAVADSALGAVDLVQPAEGRVLVVLRPEQLELELVPARADGAPAATTAVVKHVSYYGHDAMVEVALVPSAVPVLARLSGTPLPAPGDRVNVRVRGQGRTYPVR